MSKRLTCLVCPRGCQLEVSDDLVVTGNFCPRGIPYALQEIKEPKRTLTYLVKVEGQKEPLPVRTDVAVNKSLIFPIVEYLNKLVIKAPVTFNEILVENILNSGANIIASRPRR
mgnify:FL=1|jgi:CxxC motif-containing protein